MFVFSPPAGANILRVSLYYYNIYKPAGPLTVVHVKSTTSPVTSSYPVGEAYPEKKNAIASPTARPPKGPELGAPLV